MTSLKFQDISRNMMYKVYEKNNFLVQPSAKDLGMSRRAFVDYLERLGIEKVKIPIGYNKRNLSNKHLKHPKYPKAKSTYDGIKKRCYNEKEKCYPYYGGKGVSLQKEWLENFDDFFSYMITLENSFEDGYSIDRIDVEGDYCEGNVRFITHKQQCNNRSTNHIVYYEGVGYTLTELAEKKGLTYNFLKDRIDLGFTIKEAVEIPKYISRKTYYKGVK